MMPVKMVVIHFNPLDKYPPAVNLLRYLALQDKIPIVIQVITTQSEAVTWIKEIGGVQRVSLKWKKNQGKLFRYLTYFIFNVRALLHLIKTRPNLVMYYETLSSWAPIFYKRFFRKNVRLFIHYHEYNSAEEYQSGMVLNRWFHHYEKRIYPVAEWISHTNTTRMELFKNDNNPTLIRHAYIMPNYPPFLWAEISRLIKRSGEERIGFVYVGALSFDTMHIREMAEFVTTNYKNCYWDIYSDNHSSEVLIFLQSLNADNICFKGSVDYDTLPSILPKYDVGVILYNGNTPNYAFNAPNKYFEYLACGINVLFGTGMKGMYAYEQLDTKPWTRCVDFKSLQHLPFETAERVKEIPISLYYAENIYGAFANKIWNAAI